MTLPTLSEHEIIATLIALALLLGSAFLLGSLMERIKAPRVVGRSSAALCWAARCCIISSPT